MGTDNTEKEITQHKEAATLAEKSNLYIEKMSKCQGVVNRPSKVWNRIYVPVMWQTQIKQKKLKKQLKRHKSMFESFLDKRVLLSEQR